MQLHHSLVPYFSLLFTAIYLHKTADGCGRLHRRLLNPKNTGNVIQRLVGNNVQVSEYSPSGQGPVYSGDELRCSFEQSCCWKNGPNSEIVWMKASGAPELRKIQRSFDTTQEPNGDFLIASSEGARSASDKADFVSCPIACTASDITLRARHWATQSVSLKACTVTLDTNQKKNCKSWPSSNGVPDTVTLPGGDNMEIVIEATGFTARQGSVAMLDDIIVDFQPCGSSVQPQTQPLTLPLTQPPLLTTSAPVNGACMKIVCNFEQNNPCSYAGSRNGGATVPWKVVEGPYQNKLTGIDKAAEGRKFVGAYLKPGDKATLITDVKYPSNYIVRLNGYRATQGVNLFGCCNDINTCPFSTSDQVQLSDYRAWKTASMTCPSGTNRVIFHAVNDGRNEGAVGVDNIQLLLPSSSPETATQSAC